MNRQRLDAEAIRDAVLAVSGELTEQSAEQLGGPSIKVPLEPEVYDTIFTEYEPDNLWPVHPDPRQHTRRSLYLIRKRNVRLPLLVAFDARPDGRVRRASGQRPRAAIADSDEQRIYAATGPRVGPAVVQRGRGR